MRAVHLLEEEGQLRDNEVVVLLHPLVVPLHVYVLHHHAICLNGPPNFAIVPQDEVPSGHGASDGARVDGTEPDKDGLHQVAAM